ncbi:MAG TPA: ABC transporter ATP-binding protein [Phycisphaerae bacterium]|nr:ABC transporter ATP-binding protein [Phycisphaerae bacterium]HNU46726.1 ABC transporter ATP-binding protein [Phycisphaerae bacterium]
MTDNQLPIISLRGLTKSFGDKPVLRGIDLEVQPGHVLGYIGPNGAGKTTTVKILIGMLPEFEGSATVCGHDVAREPLEVKRRIGYVPESAALYDTLTPLEYLRFVGQLYGLDPQEVERRAREMLGLFDLTAELDRRMSTFSKGMRQKVLITAGMIHNPDVLFLDEPLSGLDANSVVTVKEIIARLARRGKTIFYCSHVMDVVERVCDRIVIINNGEIIADGSFEQLREMNKAASLERLFTQLTSSGGHEAVADRFIEAFEVESSAHG